MRGQDLSEYSLAHSLDSGDDGHWCDSTTPTLNVVHKETRERPVEKAISCIQDEFKIGFQTLGLCFFHSTVTPGE